MTDTARVAVVGGGIAGALLAWRLTQVRVDIFTGPARTDATAASGGLVRAFEATDAASQDALESLTELLGDVKLRAWAEYREIGSLYRLPDDSAVHDRVKLIDERLPGSITVTGTPPDLLRDGGSGHITVTERLAGHISPNALRNAVLATAGAVPWGESVTGVGPGVVVAGGRELRYDAVVVAAGPWTPALLAASGLPDAGLRTKQIQYSVFPRTGGVDRSFVDDVTGLYGRPGPDGSLLLGLPSDRWDVDPSALTVDAPLATRVRATAAETLHAFPHHVSPDRIVVAADCYHREPGLRLRPVPGGGDLYTFTGGSGGAAKTALAASRVAASALLSRIGS